jgi:hypothetical protein
LLPGRSLPGRPPERRSGRRDAGGDRCQLRVVTGGERLADARVELVLGQPALRERGLEHVDRLVAVGVRRQHVAAARRSYRLFVSWSRHRGTSLAEDKSPG